MRDVFDVLWFFAPFISHSTTPHSTSDTPSTHGGLFGRQNATSICQLPGIQEKLFSYHKLPTDKSGAYFEGRACRELYGFGTRCFRNFPAKRPSLRPQTINGCSRGSIWMSYANPFTILASISLIWSCRWCMKPPNLQFMIYVKIHSTSTFDRQSLQSSFISQGHSVKELPFVESKSFVFQLYGIEPRGSSLHLGQVICSKLIFYPTSSPGPFFNFSILYFLFLPSDIWEPLL